MTAVHGEVKAVQGLGNAELLLSIFLQWSAGNLMNARLS